MKVRNKNTGEVAEVHDDNIYLYLTNKYDPSDPIFIKYKSLKKLNEDWEDYIDETESDTSN